MKKIVFVSLFVIMAAGLVIESWFLFVPPRTISLETMQLSRVRWAEDEDINHLRDRRVIAILFISNLVGNWDGRIDIIRTAPGVIDRIVNTILKEKTPKIDIPFFSMDYMYFICDDNTGVKIGYNVSFEHKHISGMYWKSKELWQVWEGMLGYPLKCAPPPSPYMQPGITTTQAQQMERQMKENMQRKK